ncbi:hypothetical protein TSAR_011654 [Trichomalopsis sarcophagae]|uniref:Uncharacterized protein n=1 Tax=Trichomalopsis sarcophagae TaxID=543379 RepID=A0A232EH17_9HYME|nr:hypothetical protein TSAR_011654 [Trichomalopsis sarcophagae]
MAHPNTLVLELESSSIIPDIEQIDYPQPSSSIQHQNAKPGLFLAIFDANHQTEQQTQNLGLPLPNNNVALGEEVNGAEFSDMDASLEDGSNRRITHSEGSEPRFVIERESVRHYCPFGYEEKEIQGTISQPPTYANVYDWLKRCKRNLYRQLCDRGKRSDSIGLRLNKTKFSC